LQSAQEYASEQGLFLEQDMIRECLEGWRTEIAFACTRVVATMARTVTEAEQQQVPVPVSVDHWIPYSLTLDGERISEELDYPAPGSFNVDLQESLAYWMELGDAPRAGGSGVVLARLGLYQKLRYLQEGDLLPLDEEGSVMTEIEAVLAWLRTKCLGTSSEGQ
jgi:hypothetical protein